MNAIKEWWTATVGHFTLPGDKKTKSLALFVGIVLVVFLLIGVSTCQQDNREKNDLIESLKASKDSIHHFRDQNGVLHNRIQSLVLYSNQFKEVGEQLGFKVDSMKKVIKNLNGLVYYYKGQIKEEGDFMFAMEDGVEDTTSKESFGSSSNFIPVYKFKKFSYSTKYLHLEGVYNPKTDSVKGKYSYQTGFSLFVSEKKQGFFKPTLTYADIILTDPNASLINGKSLLIMQPKKWYDRRGVQIIEGAILGGLVGYGISQAVK